MAIFLFIFYYLQVIAPSHHSLQHYVVFYTRIARPLTTKHHTCEIIQESSLGKA
jgi:hypothetical protein